MAVRFDADGEDYTSNPIGLTGVPVTVLCWLKISVDRNTFSTAFCLDNGTTGNVVAAQSKVSGTDVWGLHYPDGTGVPNAGIAQTVGDWYRIAAVCETTTFKSYHGAAAGPLTLNSGAVTTAPSGLTTLRIGESAWTAEWLNGSIANFKLYSVALTLTELEAEFSSWEAVRTANLVRHHKFQVAETTDYSGNGRTLSGGTGAATDSNNPPIDIGLGNSSAMTAMMGT